MTNEEIHAQIAELQGQISCLACDVTVLRSEFCDTIASAPQATALDGGVMSVRALDRPTVSTVAITSARHSAGTDKVEITAEVIAPGYEGPEITLTFETDWKGDELARDAQARYRREAVERLEAVAKLVAEDAVADKRQIRAIAEEVCDRAVVEFARQIPELVRVAIRNPMRR